MTLTSIIEGKNFLVIGMEGLNLGGSPPPLRLGGRGELPPRLDRGREFLGLPRVPSEIHHSTPSPQPRTTPTPLPQTTPPFFSLNPTYLIDFDEGQHLKVNPYDPSLCEAKQFSRRDRKNNDEVGS